MAVCRRRCRRVPQISEGDAEAMPRPNPGPRLVVVRDKRWTDHPSGMWIVRWTERGVKRERATGIDAANPEAARAWFENWLGERRRAARTGPGDPDQVRVVDVLT